MEPGVYRVGLVADTHVPRSLSRLPEPLRNALAGAHHILHAGDLVSLSVLDELRAVAPTTAVAGNCDSPEVLRELPTSAVLSFAGRRVGMCHGHQSHRLQNLYIGSGYGDPGFDLFYQTLAARLPDCDVIVFGHFHSPVVRMWKGILFVNPGSIAPPHARPTFATLEIDKNVTARVHLLS